jgi:hypothetical protein
VMGQWLTWPTQTALAVAVLMMWEQWDVHVHHALAVLQHRPSHRCIISHQGRTWNARPVTWRLTSVQPPSCCFAGAERPHTGSPGARGQEVSSAAQSRINGCGVLHGVPACSNCWHHRR